MVTMSKLHLTPRPADWLRQPLTPSLYYRKMKNIDDIYHASKIGYSQKAKSIVDVLIEAKWTTYEKLDKAYRWLEEQSEPSAISFFQLPFPILLPSFDIEYPFSENKIPNPIINFELIGSELNSIDIGKKFEIKTRKKYNEKDTYLNASLKNEQIGLINRTQVMIKFILWRFWKDYHSQYHEAIFVKRNIKKVLYKLPVGKISKYLVDHNGVTITSGKFEYDLAKRLRLESLHIINKIIKLYSVSCRHSLPYNLQYLNNFFIMLQGGRIVILGPGSTMITQEIERLPTEKLNENLKFLYKYLQNDRDISIYEQYLLNATIK